MRLRELFENLYRPQKLIGRASSTLIQYRHAIQAAGNPDLSDVSDATFAEFMQQRLDEGLSRPSVNKERRHLMALFNFAVKRSLLPRKPDVPAVAEYHRIPRAWTVAEIGSMIDAARVERRQIGPVLAPDFWAAFLLTLYDTGVRKSALLKAKPGDCDHKRRFIWIRAENQKRGDERILPFSEQTAAALAKIAGPWEWLFPWPHDRYRNTGWKTLNEHFRRILERAGLGTTGHYFHKFRASQATYTEMMTPGSAQYVLGHCSARVTAKYLDPLILAESRLVDRLPRPG